MTFKNIRDNITQREMKEHYNTYFIITVMLKKFSRDTLARLNACEESSRSIILCLQFLQTKNLLLT